MNTISVEQIYKSYRVGAKEESHDTLVSAAMSLIQAPWRNFRRIRGLNTFRKISSETDPTLHWALRDVSFQIQEGDVVGIIGRNGAGKSTLLKILSRITEPTKGRAVIRGRVSSLLEVGTGFHPELSGRENIYMNGTILGMRSREIDRKLDQIVDFSGVEKFIDTPVKRYSSGMKVRLAFAVAAHLEPEILIIDEVLAVGDQEFQNKCLGKMGDVARSGRTVLFVSHNMAAVDALCNRGVLLSNGKVQLEGPTRDVLSEYVSNKADLVGEIVLSENCSRLMGRIVLSDRDGNVQHSFLMGAEFNVTVHYSSERAFSPVLGVVVKNLMGVPIFGIDNRIQAGFLFPPIEGNACITCTIERLPLMPGLYSLDVWLGNEFCSLDHQLEAIEFEVLASNVLGNGKLPPENCGHVFQVARWRAEKMTGGRDE